MRKEEILRLIKETIAKTMLSGAKVILFGPQARGDAREDSDWDILILLNKLDDHDYISYPFFELG
jgi:predicted nucleotidyltransferase